LNPLEVELKLAIAAGSIPALRAFLAAASARRGGAATLHNTYFDTPGLHLLRRRVGLRVRKHGRRLLQTVKCTGVVTAGLSSRNEWEQPHRGDFDFAAIGDAAIRRLLERRRDRLVPVFTTHFRREIWIAQPAAGCEIEVAIDRGEIVAGDRKESITEIELELRNGSPACLLAFARRLADAVAVLPDDRSKAERGYALFEQRTLTLPRRALPVALDAAAAPGDAFSRIAWECLDQIAANMRGASEADDPEFAHQLRVGVRRLRSALRLFGPLLPPPSVESLRAGSHALAQLPAATREWDVLLHDIVEPAAAQAPAHAGIAALAACVRARRDAARAALQAALRGTAPGATLLVLMADVAALAETPPDAAQPQLAQFAATRIARFGRRVARRACDARDSDPGNLHALRLAIKRLRYSLEFVGALVRNRHAVPMRQLVSLQGSLGLLNDLHAAAPLVESVAHDEPHLLPAIALVGGHHLAAWHALGDGRLLRGTDWKRLGRGWRARP